MADNFRGYFFAAPSIFLSRPLMRFVIFMFCNFISSNFGSPLFIRPTSLVNPLRWLLISNWIASLKCRSTCALPEIWGFFSGQVTPCLNSECHVFYGSFTNVFSTDKKTCLKTLLELLLHPWCIALVAVTWRRRRLGQQTARASSSVARVFVITLTTARQIASVGESLSTDLTSTGSTHFGLVASWQGKTDNCNASCGRFWAVKKSSRSKTCAEVQNFGLIPYFLEKKPGAKLLFRNANLVVKPPVLENMVA